MAPFVKFVMPLAAAFLGLWALLAWWFWTGLIAFVVIFVLGSLCGTYLFKRMASPDQIKDDLRARLDND